MRRWVSLLTTLVMLALAAMWGGLVIRVYPRWEGWSRDFGGWRTTNEIVVLESDDWGRPGVPSADSLLELVSGLPLDEFLLPLIRSDFPWLRYAVETPGDLERVYTLLEGHRDSRGRSAVFTANVVMSHPDYTSLLDSATDGYVYNPQSERLVQQWRHGIERGVFFPQFHGRDHFNVPALTRDVRGEDVPFLTESLERGFFPAVVFTAEGTRVYDGAYVDLSVSPSEGLSYEAQCAVIAEGVELFKEALGFAPISTVAPFYVWNDDTERCWAEAGIRYIQAGNRGNRGPSGERRKAGDRNDSGQVFLPRNIDFEPFDDADALTTTLAAVDELFRQGHPVVISTHSVNYVSTVDPQMAVEGIAALDELLEELHTRYPGLMYLTSPELGQLIEQGEFQDVFTGEVVRPPGSSWSRYAWLASDRVFFGLLLVVVTSFLLGLGLLRLVWLQLA